MVDLAKIRKKAKKKDAEARTADDPARTADDSVRTAADPPGTAGVPPADVRASRPHERARDARASAAETAAVREEAPAAAAEAAAIDKLERFKAEAGKRRDVRVEQVAETAHQLELLTFVIAGEQYAIDIEKIVEIVTPRPVTRIPNADPSVVGIISLRGTIVTLVDVRRKLRHRAAGDGAENARIVVIDLDTAHHKETVGFVVDRVLRVVKVEPSVVEPHPVVHTNELEDAIRGVFRASGALTILLDLDKLLDHSQWT